MVGVGCVTIIALNKTLVKDKDLLPYLGKVLIGTAGEED